MLNISFRGAFLIDTFTLGEGSQAVRFETSTATSMIQAEEAMAVQLPMSVKRRKMSTAKEGNVHFRDTAGVWKKFSRCGTNRNMSKHV